MERLLDIFVEAADTLVDDFDVVDFLHKVADHTADISGASSVGLLLSDDKERLRFMAASSDGAEHLELFQIQHAEGPCLDCFGSGRPVIVEDLSVMGDRWPVFVPRATELGIRSVHAFPMRLRNRVIGALNVFGIEPLPLGKDDVRVIQALADVATIAIIQERAVTAAETVTEQLQGALNSRTVVEQAKGVVAHSRGIGVDEAFTLLRSAARRSGTRLVDLCLDVLSGAVAPSTFERASES